MNRPRITHSNLYRMDITRGAAWGLLVTFISSVLMFAISIAFTARSAKSASDDANRAVRESQQVWCDVLDYIAERQRSTPTPTEFANKIQKLRRDNGCEKPK